MNARMRALDSSEDEDELAGVANKLDMMRNRMQTPGSSSWKADSVAGYSKTSGSKLNASGPVNISNKGNASAVVDPNEDLGNPKYNEALTDVRSTRDRLG